MTKELITKELLSIVLDIPIGAITELKPYTENDIVYTTYTLPTIKYKILNLDTLGRLCKEWLYSKDIHFSYQTIQEREESPHNHFVELQKKYGFHGITELEAIIKATEWVAREKGLL